MQFLRSLEPARLPGSWLTVGSYDGVHRGHQAILKALISGAHAEGLPAAAVIFDPHPIRVLRPDIPLQLLTTIEERAEILSGLGLDILVAHPFNREVAALPAESFVQLLKDHLAFKQFLVGFNFAMGKDRDGDIPHLRELSTRYGYELRVFEPVGKDSPAVSSSRIRAAIGDGRVADAAAMLGRPYSLTGRVAQGARRGRSIGFPTANIDVPTGRAVPASGVYACQITLEGAVYAAAANIGVRPTFEPGVTQQTVEAHILDFDREIYDREVHIAFLRRLRGERKFASIDALVAQIRKDVIRTREVLDETVP